jgi:hypothetical protein
MHYTYEFSFENGRIERFELQMDPETLNLQPLSVDVEQEWTRLENHQCPDCRLSRDCHARCPVARNLSSVLLRFKDDISFTLVRTRVIGERREIEKNGALQDCVFPLIGLIMACSGCPTMERLKPMAFTHLPFSSSEETIIRSLSTYLLGQYLRMRKGLSADWELKGFSRQYEKISDINSAFAERVRDIPGRDANINALIILDTFAQMGSVPDLSEFVTLIEPFFGSFLQDG